LLKIRFATGKIRRKEKLDCDICHSFVLAPRLNIAAMVQKDGDLKQRTKRLALNIIRLYRSLPGTDEARIVGRQLLRSGTSVGANYRAACRARSKAEFIAKLGIVLEESDETVFWLELLVEAGVGSREKVQSLVTEADELTSIFVTSLRTAKGIASSA
jgi:four helix bundle protein